MVVEPVCAPEALEQLEEKLRASLPDLLAETGALLEQEFPGYAAFLSENTGEVVESAGLFVGRLLAMAQRGLSNLPVEPLESEEEIQGLFEQIGRVEMSRGRELTPLLSAYQIGARAAWRRVSATGLDLGLAPDVLAALAEAVFVFVNQLSSASAHGYVQEQSESATSRERLREDLCQLLLSDRASSEAIAAAAQRAGWPRPASAAVVLVEPDDEAASLAADRLGPEALPIRTPTLRGAIVPDPGAGEVRRRRVGRALGGNNAVIGHTVPLTLLPASVRIAQAAQDLQRRGVLTGDPLFAEDHLDTLIVQRDERLFAALRTRELRPLEGLTEASRARMQETLAAWLRHMGDRRSVAAELQVHPQTVRYRMARLHELFGDALDDPASRARLFLVLTWDGG